MSDEQWALDRRDFDHLNKRVKALETQNTELLAVLKSLIDAAAPVANIAYNLGQTHSQWESSVYPSILKLDEGMGIARVALSKAKGQK